MVWDVGKALRGEQAAEDVLPIAYMSISGTPVRGVAAARHPTSDNNGVARYDADPTYAVFGSYEGALTLADIRDPEGSVEVNKQRSESARAYVDAWLTCRTCVGRSVVSSACVGGVHGRGWNDEHPAGVRGREASK